MYYCRQKKRLGRVTLNRRVFFSLGLTTCNNSGMNVSISRIWAASSIRMLSNCKKKIKNDNIPISMSDI